MLTRKIGPLPTWVWVTIVAAGIIGWAYFRTGKNTAAPASSGSSQVPQFVNQTFTTVEPPAPEEPEPRTRQHHRRDRDHDKDDDDKRGKCPPGYHFEATPKNSDIAFIGKQVRGGYCVPNTPSPKKKGGGDTGPPTREQ